MCVCRCACHLRAIELGSLNAVGLLGCSVAEPMARDEVGLVSIVCWQDLWPWLTDPGP